MISESILFATVAAMMLILICCISNNGVELYTGRDEHEDTREDPDLLLREDTLWRSLENKYDPYNISHTQESNLLGQAPIDPVGYRESNGPWVDYMGNYEYNTRGNPYAGRIFTYPTHKVGGAYLSPNYKLNDEDTVQTRPMNYFTSKELFTSAGHMGLTTGDRNKDYMNIATTVHDYYDDLDYEEGVVGPSTDGPRMNLTRFDKNRPVNVSSPASFYRERLDYFPDGESTPTKLATLQRSIVPESYDTDKNFYNVTNTGYLMDMSGQGAFETPLGPEMNNINIEELDTWQFKQTGPMDVTRPTLNWDAWYNGSENFTSAEHRTNWGELTHPSVDDKTKLEQFIPSRNNVRSDITDDLDVHDELWSDPRQMEFPTGERSLSKAR